MNRDAFSVLIAPKVGKRANVGTEDLEKAIQEVSFAHTGQYTLGTLSEAMNDTK